jgi:hypothetical protein
MSDAVPEAAVPGPALDPMAAAVHECLVFTRWSIVDLEPSSLERVAAYLAGLLEREPLRSRPGWEQERIVLGCLMTDLRTMVRAAGEPIGAARDLRDARTRRDEIDAQRRIELEERAYHDLVTDAIASDRASGVLVSAAGAAGAAPDRPAWV